MVARGTYRTHGGPPAREPGQVRGALLGPVIVGVAALAVGAGCDESKAPDEVPVADAAVGDRGDSTSGPTTTERSLATSPTPSPVATASSSSPSVATTVAPVVTPSLAAPTTVATSTAPAMAEDHPSGLAADAEVVEIGRSVEDRPINVIRRGEPGGTAVLVIGVIHGDEDAGAAIVAELSTAEVPDGIELWLVPSMNPDGQAMQLRHNANGVDLNRNFPVDWGPIADHGDWQYAGPSAASEPETQAMLELTELVRPDLTLWYHQDLFRINPAGGREGEVRARYAELTGLPMVEVSGGRYTGTASTWSRSIAAPAGVGFTVELGPELSPDDALRHAGAVLTVAAEL